MFQRALDFGQQAFGASGVEDDTGQLEAGPQHLRIDPDWGMATGPQRGEQGPLRHDGGAGEGTRDLVEQAGDERIFPALDAQGPLPNGPKHLGRSQGERNAVSQLEALQPGGREDEGVVFSGVEFAEAGLDIAADFGELQIGTQVQQLGLAAEAPRAHAGVGGEFGE